MSPSGCSRSIGRAELLVGAVLRLQPRLEGPLSPPVPAVRPTRMRLALGPLMADQAGPAVAPARRTLGLAQCIGCPTPLALDLFLAINSSSGSRVLPSVRFWYSRASGLVLNHTASRAQCFRLCEEDDAIIELSTGHRCLRFGGRQADNAWGTVCATFSWRLRQYRPRSLEWRNRSTRSRPIPVRAYFLDGDSARSRELPPGDNAFLAKDSEGDAALGLIDGDGSVSAS